MSNPEALAIGRIVQFVLSERETTNPERVGVIVPAIVVDAGQTADGKRFADLAVIVSGIDDLPYSVTFDPKLRRAPMIFAPLVLVSGAAEGSENGQFFFPKR